MIVVVGLLLSAISASSAQAVVISGSTYAAETGGPGPDPVSKSYPPPTTSPTSVSGNIRSDVVYSHAQSWAQATVTPSGVVKSVGGRGWIDTPPTAIAPLYDAKSNLWNAYASGTQLIINGPAGTASTHFVIPANGIPSQFNAMPANAPPGSTTNPLGDPGSITPPANGQGLVVNGSLGTGSMPSFFDIFVQLDVTAQQGAASQVDLFHGTFLVDPNTLQFQGTGGFAGLNPVITPSTGNPNSPQYTITFPTDIAGGTFDPLVGLPFNLNFDEYMTMGDPNRQFPSVTPTGFDFSSRSGGPVGAGGAFAAEFLLDNPSTYSLSAAPEPSSLVLALIGGLGVLVAIRRRQSQ
jgi:hypothetical protein